MPSGPSDEIPDDALAALAGSDGSDAEDAEPMSFRQRTARIAALAGIALIAGLWGWALFGPHSTTMPGTLADRTFPDAAETICTEAAGRLAQLPPSYATTDHVARAQVVATSDGILTDMLDRLDAIAPAGDDTDAAMVREWLGDWRTYVGDRATYAKNLAEDASTRFYVTKKEKRQITVPIDFFATANHMDNCVTPGDIE